MQLKYKYLYIVSVLLLLSGAALALTEQLLFDILYALGAVGYGLYYVLAPERDASPLLRRVAPTRAVRPSSSSYTIASSPLLWRRRHSLMLLCRSVIR